MLNLVIAAVLVGLPAGAGAYLFANPSTERDPTAGSVLLFYATALAAALTLFNPEGTLLRRVVWLEMTGALILGCTIGALVGWVQRTKGK